MRRLIAHVIVPAVAPAAIVGLYFTPVLLFGCVNRGLMAVAVALASAVGAFVALGLSARAMQRRDWARYRLWLLSAAVLTLPLALLVGPLG
jgi:hypothetical protein